MTTDTDARGLLRECRDYVLQYKLDNPKHFYRGVEQDPMGAHGLLDRLDAFLTAAPTTNQLLINTELVVAPVGVPEEPAHESSCTYMDAGHGRKCNCWYPIKLKVYAETLRTALAAARSEALDSLKDEK